MLLDEKPLHHLTLVDVRELISQGICESQRVEFKSEWWGGGDEDRREMLRDISSMANAQGGFIILGLVTERSIVGGNLDCPKSVSGLPHNNYGEMVQRSCRDALDPPCYGVDIAQIDLDQGGVVVILKVPQSIDAPHMVTFKGLNQFWQRHGTDKQKMSTREIRDLFMSRLNDLDRLIEFVRRRIIELQEDHSNLEILYVWASPLVPTASEVDVKSPNIKDLFERPLLNLPFGHNLYSGPPRPTLDGIESQQRHMDRLQFIRLFRRGFLEFGTEHAITSEESKYIDAFGVSAYMTNFSGVTTQVFRTLEIQGPVAFGCALVNVRGYRLHLAKSPGELSDATWPTRNLDLGNEVSYEFDSEKNLIVRRLSDKLWNAFHHDECPFFASGELVAP